MGLFDGNGNGQSISRAAEFTENSHWGGGGRGWGGWGGVNDRCIF